MQRDLGKMKSGVFWGRLLKRRLVSPVFSLPAALVSPVPSIPPHPSDLGTPGEEHGADGTHGLGIIWSLEISEELGTLSHTHTTKPAFRPASGAPVSPSRGCPPRSPWPARSMPTSPTLRCSRWQAQRPYRRSVLQSPSPDTEPRPLLGSYPRSTPG